jgi:molybdopterin converting factor small subunit
LGVSSPIASSAAPAEPAEQPTGVILVHIPPPLRERCGNRSELTLPAGTVREALARLERSHPELHRGLCDETGALRRHIGVFVQSDHIRDRKGLDTALRPGEALTFLPAVSGG